MPANISGYTVRYDGQCHVFFVLVKVKDYAHSIFCFNSVYFSSNVGLKVNTLN